ncbi:hypothetical protein [Nocardioides sp.]|uniref:hypothetical protein n=1 Tax=Nocardioides sp. TaxID=35761 RepID=UPI0027364A25|nr:hypothetical protein [Nocardioides sp.]MDP3890969.1 hypothetical protein [Nocardioides sp.]
MSPNRADEHLARLEAMVAEIQQQERQSRQELNDALARQAAAARDGRLGKDWEDVQRRVDAGVTTIPDVLSGRDDSPAARRLAELSRRNLTAMAEQYRADPDNVEELAQTEAEWVRLARGAAAPEDGSRD